jgi:hypothetical protein
MPREQIIHSKSSHDARAFNACMYRIIHLKPHFVGAIGLCEEMEVEAYRMLQEGLERHYGISPEHTRFPIRALRGRQGTWRGRSSND